MKGLSYLFSVQLGLLTMRQTNINLGPSLREMSGQMVGSIYRTVLSTRTAKGDGEMGESASQITFDRLIDKRIHIV